MSTILVIGGTGYAGAHIVKEAAARGHQVTSLSRRLPAEEIDGVRYVQGDARDSSSAVHGADVVVGALSPRAGSEGAMASIYSAIAQAAAAEGARLVIIGGFGSLRPEPGATRFAESGGMPPEYAAEASEMNSVLVALESGSPEGLDWVFVSPAATFGAHVPGERRGSYRSGTGIAIFDEDGQSAIGGEDFALAVVDEIDTPRHHRAHINFTN